MSRTYYSPLPSLPLLILGLPALSAGTWSCHATTISTTHYYGVFDPETQVPEELYRITITGDTPWYSNVKYGSGWVPARVADLLVTDIRHDDSGKVAITNNNGQGARVEAQRRFFEFGPSGVYMQPKDARFVVVMGSDPDYFFKKVGLLTRFDSDNTATASSISALATDVSKKQQVAATATEEALAKQAAELANGAN